MDLATLIRAWIAQDGDDRVERLLLGTGDPVVLADRIHQVARAELRVGIAAGRFWQTSVGCVAGVELEDGRWVVIKAHPPTQRRAYLEAVHRLWLELCDSGFPCPRPLAVAEHRGVHFTIEEWLERGEWRDGHLPAVRRAMARGLADMVNRLRSHANEAVLANPWHALPPDQRWPLPHSPIFDFASTAIGAEWIDAIADRARRVMAHSVGERVVGHFDWRVEHLRFEGDRVATVWDWDSLHAAPEPVLVGRIAHAFPADWSREGVRRQPTIEEIFGFIEDYESARGRSFDRSERRLIGASCTWAIAYTARCTHALSPSARPAAGDDDARAMLALAAEALLDQR